MAGGGRAASRRTVDTRRMVARGRRATRDALPFSPPPPVKIATQRNRRLAISYNSAATSGRWGLRPGSAHLPFHSGSPTSGQRLPLSATAAGGAFPAAAGRETRFAGPPGAHPAAAVPSSILRAVSAPAVSAYSERAPTAVVAAEATTEAAAVTGRHVRGVPSPQILGGTISKPYQPRPPPPPSRSRPDPRHSLPRCMSCHHSFHSLPLRHHL